ncbi:MAG: hypothetical protein H0T52_06625, partial [Lautropia sp.]|nr:hypothetical protein [Lautropia sp.]
MKGLKIALAIGTLITVVEGRSAQAVEGVDDNEASVAIVPSAFVKNAMLATGCWARLYGRTNFSGDVLTVAGPVDLPKAELRPAFRWG